MPKSGNFLLLDVYDIVHSAGLSFKALFLDGMAPSFAFAIKEHKSFLVKKRLSRHCTLTWRYRYSQKAEAQQWRHPAERTQQWAEMCHPTEWRVSAQLRRRKKSIISLEDISSLEALEE